MSHLMTALAMRQTGIKPTTKIVLYWLADHHNGETGRCFPSIKTLAVECEMDVATVKRHLIKLEELGLIQRHERHRENGSQTSSEYTLCFGDPLAQNAPPPGANCAPPLAQNDPPLNLGSNNLGSEQDRDLEIPTKSKRKKPATSLPEDWTPDPIKVKALMDEHNLSKDDMIFTFEQLKGQADAKDIKYVNWDAAYANWIRNNIKWGNIGPNARGRTIGANGETRDPAFD